MSDEPTSDQDIVEEAERRYHLDAEFHATVYRSVQMVVPNTVSEPINVALREAATSAASVALVLAEQSAAPGALGDTQ